MDNLKNIQEAISNNFGKVAKSLDNLASRLIGQEVTLNVLIDMILSEEEQQKLKENINKKSEQIAEEISQKINNSKQ